MKTLLATLALAFCSLSLLAQTYGTISLTSFPSGIVAGGTSNVNQVIDCRANRNVAFYIAGKAGGATNTTMVVTVLPQLDGTTLIGTNIGAWTFTLTIPTNSLATMVTNIDVGAIGHLQVTTAVGGVNAVTNSACTVALKPGN